MITDVTLNYTKILQSLFILTTLYNISNLLATTIEQINSKSPSKRLRREQFWMTKLHTKYCNGLNTYRIIYSK